MLKYRFRLKIGSAAYVDCHPRWSGNDTSIVTEQGENEMYYRDKLAAKLTFQRSDFDAIHAAPFETEFRVLLQEFISGSWTSLNVAKFFKTDFELVDEDNKTIVVSPITFDVYEKVLEGMDKEYDLIALAPPTVSVNYLRQAILQIYLPGASYIANFTDGVYWELPVTPFNTTPPPGGTDDGTHHDAMLNDYGFGIGRGFSAPDDGLPNYARVVIPGGIDVSGVYQARTYTDINGTPQITQTPSSSYLRLDGLYAIVEDSAQPVGSVKYYIRRVSDNVDLYETPVFSTPYSPFGQPPHSSPNATFEGLFSANTCEAYQFMPYVRLLTNKDMVGSDSTVELPDDDPFSPGVFTHALPIETLNFEYGYESSTTPSRWGKVSEDAIYFGGEYFVKPTSTETLMPVAATTWTAAFAWFWFDNDLRDLQVAASDAITLKDCYKFSDVINTLLTTIGATVGHDDDPAYSDFLYATSNAIRGSRLVPVITPKSNVLVGEYDQPAQKAPIRLRELLDLARDFWNAYWHISETKFKVEHRHYYDNGKSYTTPGIGIDLTTALEPRTGLPWSYRTSNYKYDKERLPSRFEFKWMDNVSKPFEGYPIDINSTYVNRGSVEQKRLSRFTSDIDFFNVAASDIDKNGFVLFECEEDGDELNVPFVEITVDTDETYKLQNGYASYLYAHETYWRHGLPATDVNLNRQDITATTTIRTKNQDLEIAVGSDVDEYLLITSKLGNAKIAKIEKNLSSKSLKITLKHDTL